MRRLMVPVAVVAVVVLAVMSWSAASAGTASVKIGGVETFTPNALINSTFHFTPGPITVKSGDSVTFTNGTPDPHTVSVVNQSDLPTNIDELFECAACQQVFILSNGTGVVGNGANGELASKPDSVFVSPAGAPGSTLSVKITASAGTTLRYMCAIHPWMQGTINVK